MDKFGVPKKINRHVLKALYFKYEDGDENPDFTEICDLVEFSMKNNVPVRDLAGAVRQSLKNMAHLGVIGRNGSRFYVRNPKPNPLLPKRVNPKIFGINGKGHENRSRLDPNLRKRHASDESISGNEIKKTRKRFSSVRPLRRRGQNVFLPKVRKSPTNYDMNADFDQDGNTNEENCNNQEDEMGSDYFLNALLKNRFFSQMSDTKMDQPQPQNEQSCENGEHSEENQNASDEEHTEEKQDMNSDREEDRPLTTKTETHNKEVWTTEQHVGEEEKPKCSTDPQPVPSKKETVM